MFNFPFSYYRYPYHYYNYYNKNIDKNSNTDNNYNNNDNNRERKNSITNLNQISNTIENNDFKQAIFEIFGIKIYVDDLIILGILFLLYEQNVKDEMLYIILFLLLFS